VDDLEKRLAALKGQEAAARQAAEEARRRQAVAEDRVRSAVAALREQFGVTTVEEAQELRSRVEEELAAELARAESLLQQAGAQ
jgi:hypothetical protein